MSNTTVLTEKWSPVLACEDAPKIKDSYRAGITAQLLENTELAQRQLTEANLSVSANTVQGMGTVGQQIDPVMIALVRRSIPNLIAFDVAGVQAMTAPTGLIFAMQPKYRPGETNESDAFVTGLLGANAIKTAFSGPVATASGEGTITNDMGFDIIRTSVTAKTRQLKTGYTLELAQDLKAVHGLDAEAELANILTTEFLAEINREIIDVINGAAQAGGNFDLVADADGRWAAEKFKSLAFKIETVANSIAKRTRRGKGNVAIVSSNIASALAASGVLDYSPALSTKLEVDDTGTTFAGVLNGRLKVFIDPYAVTDYVTVGYRGTSQYDAGIFYCPYRPLEMIRAVDPTNFQSIIAYKTRYGIVANPFVEAYDATYKGLAGSTNPYYQTFAVTNINVGGQS